MDLYSGLPYWLVKDPLYNYYNPLTEDTRTRVAVIGSGITGALVAHELCRAGIECAIVDKRSLATGSSSASTALLQYEIDVPLCELQKMVGQEAAVMAYRSCLQAISDIEKVIWQTDCNASFQRVPTLYLASNYKGLKLIEQEYEWRTRYGLPVTFLTSDQLRAQFGVPADGALLNRASAQMDAYQAAVCLMDYNLETAGLKIFSHTEIVRWERRPDHYELITDRGKKLTCDYVVIAAGFEAGPFLPIKMHSLTTTFAIASQPVDEQYLWPERALMWETKEPYLYIRTDDRNRIIVGGEDENMNDPQRRERVMHRKARVLERKFKEKFPHIPFITEMIWSGTFSSTPDGLPYIGVSRTDPRMLFALGYGGNGITFSMIAAQIIRNTIRHESDIRQKAFGIDR